MPSVSPLCVTQSTTSSGKSFSKTNPVVGFFPSSSLGVCYMGRRLDPATDALSASSPNPGGETTLGLSFWS